MRVMTGQLSVGSLIISNKVFYRLVQQREGKGCIPRRDVRDLQVIAMLGALGCTKSDTHY